MREEKWAQPKTSRKFYIAKTKIYAEEKISTHSYQNLPQRFKKGRSQTQEKNL